VRRTSIDAYRTIRDNGLLSARRWEAYDILYRYGPMTSNEIFERAKLHGNPNYRHNTNARMTELRDRGVAVEVGTKKCSVTGHNVILWDVTEALPRKPTRSVSVRPSKKELRDAANELRGIYKFLRDHGHEGFSDNLKRVGRWMDGPTRRSDD
jgi:hypothetical protein